MLLEQLSFPNPAYDAQVEHIVELKRLKDEAWERAIEFYWGSDHHTECVGVYNDLVDKLTIAELTLENTPKTLSRW